MTKLSYNGQEIELPDDLEKGFVELDLLTEEDLNTKDLTQTVRVINQITNQDKTILEDVDGS